MSPDNGSPHLRPAPERWPHQTPASISAPADPASLLSVIVPAFNPGLEALSETLQSLRAATLQGFQLIVVDDGSTDPAFELLLDNLPSHWPGLTRVRHAARRGLSAARNTGVAHCATPFYVQLDADDQLRPTFLEKALWVLATNPQWSFCNSWTEGFGAQEYQWEGSFSAGDLFRIENPVPPMAMIRREADRAIGGHTEAIRDGAEDWDYWLKMAAHGYWGVTLPEYLARYRHHALPTYWRNRDHPWFQYRFARQMRRRYPQLWRSNFPEAQPPARDEPTDDLPFAWPLPAPPGKPRLLVLASDLGDAAVATGYHRLRQIILPDQPLTVCVTECSPAAVGLAAPAGTADFLSWRHFLEPAGYPRFARYLVETRRAQAIVILGSRAGYRLLPYLQARFPELQCWEFRPNLVEEARQDAPEAAGWMPNILAEVGEPNFIQAGAATGAAGRFRRLTTPRAAGDVALTLAEITREFASLETVVPWWQIDTPWRERRRSSLYRLKRRWIWPLHDAGERWLRHISRRRRGTRPAARGPG